MRANYRGMTTNVLWDICYGTDNDQAQIAFDEIVRRVVLRISRRARYYRHMARRRK